MSGVVVLVLFHIFFYFICCHAPGEFLRKEHGEDLWQMPPTLGSETVVMVVNCGEWNRPNPFFPKALEEKAQQRKGDYSISHFVVGIIIFMQFL